MSIRGLSISILSVALLTVPWPGDALRLEGSMPASVARAVTFRAEDGTLLAGTWYEPVHRPAPAVILVHMLDRSRRDWEVIASRLAADGIGALTLDLRGHGDSQYAQRPSSPAELGALVADIAAARRFLGARPEVQPGRIGIAGASLGASLAVLAAAQSGTVVSVALLSPSLDYQGLRIEATARKVARPMLLVASDEDGYASRSVKDLQKAGGGVRETVLLHHAGHGTVMLGRDPSLAWTLVEWFRRTL